MTRKVKLLFSKETFWAIILVLILYALGYIPLINNSFHVPVDREYFFTWDYPIDQIGDMIGVREGYLGHWFHIQKISTSIPEKPSIDRVEYIIMGHIARIIHIDPIRMYIIGRIIISLIYILFVFILIRFIFKKRLERMSAFILALFGTGIMFSGRIFNVLLQLHADVRVFQRLPTARAPYLLGGLFLLISLYFLARVLDEPKKIKYLLLSFFFSMCASQAYLPISIPTLISLPFYIFIKYIPNIIKKEKLSGLMIQLIILFLYSIALLIPVYYFRFILVPQYVEFQTLIGGTDDINWSSVTISNYFFTVGFVYLISIFSIPSILRKKSTLLNLFIPWIIIHPVCAIFISKMLTINSYRFYLMPYWIIYAILATVGISNISQWFSNRFIKIKYHYVIIFIIISTLFPSWNYYIASYHWNDVCFCKQPRFLDFAFPKKTEMNAIYWLRDHTKEKDIVLSDTYAGALIPAFANNRVYYSFWYDGVTNGVNLPVRKLVMNDVDRFYSLNMSDLEANNYLAYNHISYIYYGEQERQRTNINLSYSALQNVYQNDDVIIYKVML
jgi:hypothetical protein